MNQRENWSSKLGFILTSVGTAIGLGNIWMFSWRLGQYGGAAFLVPYIFFVFVLGTIGVMGEFGLGRSQQRGSIGAFEKVFKEKNLPLGSKIGLLPVIAQAGVFIFYSVVVGWVIKYFFMAATGSLFNGDIPEMFHKLAGQNQSILWHFIAIFITFIIVIRGISKGIEKVNKIIMPSLFIIFVILIVKSLTLPNASEGIKYLLVPDWSYLLKPITWVMALGQAFFTVSLGGASMVVLGSYLKDEEDIPRAAINTSIFDTLAAFLAAFIIIPAAFSFGLDPTTGPPLLFITVPFIFKQMIGGQIFAILFFLSVVFAAISTTIVLMEVMVESIMDRLKWSRVKSTILISIITFVIGIPLDVNMSLFGKFVDVVTIYLVPIGALLAGITFFWIYGSEKAREEINKGSKKQLGKWFEYLSKYIFVIGSAIVIILSIIYSGIG